MFFNRFIGNIKTCRHVRLSRSFPLLMILFIGLKLILPNQQHSLPVNFCAQTARKREIKKSSNCSSVDFCFKKKIVKRSMKPGPSILEYAFQLYTYLRRTVKEKKILMQTHLTISILPQCTCTTLYAMYTDGPFVCVFCSLVNMFLFFLSISPFSVLFYSLCAIAGPFVFASIKCLKLT